MVQGLSVFCDGIASNLRPRKLEGDLFASAGQLFIARKIASQDFADAVAERVDVSRRNQQLWKVVQDVARTGNVIRDGGQTRRELLDDGHSKTLDVAWKNPERAIRES